MCQPASGVLTRDQVWWDEDSDSHEAIIRKHKLHADGVRGPNVLRFEIVPPDDDYTLPLAEWVYKVDQDILPEWYDPVHDPVRARSMMPAWAQHHIISSGEVRDGQTRVVLSGSVTQIGGKCRVYGGGQNTQNDGWCYVHGGGQNTQNGGTCWVHSGGTNTQSGGLCDVYSGGTNTQNDGTCYVYGGGQNTQSDGWCRVYGGTNIDLRGGEDEMPD